MREWLVNRVTITSLVIVLAVVGWNIYVVAHDDGILKGVVVDENGAPVPGAKVVLNERTIVSLAPIAETVTDEQGRFGFVGHDRHRVVIEAEKPGLGESDRVEVKLLFRNQNMQLADPVRLQPSA